ncbi:DUF7344 domain-containing protein [Halomarina oriensis]|uniref:DUF7344 domain-containing protein n=1 Tax=Halomarina oriensis TaxID=671145 RepID=A0A6B0GRQ3_9EURY|nr:hypothetical protein [Halomarina oriensis]MWG36339.1 hypothetical protein [Halomarina oriensis]
MSIHSATPPFTDDSPRQPDETLGRVFEDARRRTLLRVLATCTGTIELDDLTDRVVAAETDHPSTGDDADRFDRALVSLYRCHLPAFVAADLVELDESGGVFVTPLTEVIAELV